jgi:hypothetical protein
MEEIDFVNKSLAKRSTFPILTTIRGAKKADLRLDSLPALTGDGFSSLPFGVVFMSDLLQICIVLYHHEVEGYIGSHCLALSSPGQ